MINRKMSEDELLAIVEHAEKEAVAYNGEFMEINDNLQDRYNNEDYGDEVDGRSKVQSSDVLDLVESDMPALARIFLGSEEPVTFKPTSDRKEDIEEARQKTQYVKWLIDNQEDSFAIQHAWLKGGLLQQCSVLHYGVEDTRKVSVKKYDNISGIEAAQLIEEIEADTDTKAEIIGHDENEDGTFYLEVRTTTGTQDFFIDNVAPEDFIISKGAIHKNKTEILGTRTNKTRSYLIAKGFDEKTVREIPAFTGHRDEITWERHKDEGGNNEDNKVQHWASEEVEVSDLYILVDYDNDGIAERRHIIKAGNKILENEPFDHVPFAIFSTILMPHKLIGKARAELVVDTQRTKTVVKRQTLDNLYQVNTPRNVISGAVNIDDMLTVRPNGLIRLDDDDALPANAIMPLVTPYVGDKALMIVQYLDSERAATTGHNETNQGLTSDQVGKETATRFEGMDDARKAKIELVARVIAETGYTQLYEGLAWYVSKYQDEEKEIRVLKKAMTVNPANWKHDHKIKAQVGLGVGDNDAVSKNMGQLLQVSATLQEKGSVLTDEKKIYSILSRVVKSMGMHDVSEFFNDPEIEEEVLMAENAMLKAQMKNMQQPNQLAEAEQVKAQAAIQIANEKHQLDMIKLQTEITSKHDIEMKKIMAKFTELELKFGMDIPGEGMGA